MGQSALGAWCAEQPLVALLLAVERHVILCCPLRPGLGIDQAGLFGEIQHRLVHLGVLAVHALEQRFLAVGHDQQLGNVRIGQVVLAPLGLQQLAALAAQPSQPRVEIARAEVAEDL
ncbi:hypothetical protein D3C78_559700 [compost metagenome]